MEKNGGKRKALKKQRDATAKEEKIDNKAAAAAEAKMTLGICSSISNETIEVDD